jgi:chaperone modulatory protein CbpM
MAEIFVLAAETDVVEEQVSFTPSALCQASGAHQARGLGLVGECPLQPTRHGPEDRRCGGDTLSQTRKALRLARDFELDPAAVGLVMGLLAEIDRLRARLRHV